MNNSINIIAAIGLLPVIKIDSPKEEAKPLAEALLTGGLPVAEITFRTAGAEQAIEIMRSTYPEMLVGAGTVLTIDQIDRAVSAGAQFLVSPGFNRKNVAYCQKIGITIIPGCITPTEIEEALAMGVNNLKFFPAEQFGGLNTIKALSAPFSQVKFVPTGGINLSNLGKYLANTHVLACGGSFMVTADLLMQKNWNEVTAICKESVAVIKLARG